MNGNFTISCPSRNCCECYSDREYYENASNDRISFDGQPDALNMLDEISRMDGRRALRWSSLISLWDSRVSTRVATRVAIRVAIRATLSYRSSDSGLSLWTIALSNCQRRKLYGGRQSGTASSQPKWHLVKHLVNAFSRLRLQPWIRLRQLSFVPFLSAG